MKKKNLLLTFLLAALVFGGAKAQNTVTIGTGTSTTVNSPINTRVAYSLSETIYLSSEINQSSKSITSIAYYYNRTTAIDYNIDVYMQNTTKTSFSSSSDYVTVASTDLVFSGTVSFPNTAGWVTITLDTPFEYDSNNNLLIVVDNNLGTGDGSWANYPFRYTSTTNNTCWYASGTTNYDPTSSQNGSVPGSMRPNIQITFKDEAIFPVPTGLTASPIKTYEATLTWNETENATSYNVKYHEASSTEWTTETGLATNSLALSNLDSETEYEAQVQAVYSEGTSEWSASYSFTTLPVAENKVYNNNWSNAYNWTTGVPTENHDVLISYDIYVNCAAAANNITIATGKTMTIQNGYSLTCNSITNNGNLIIEEGGQLICNYSTTATIKKDIDAASTWGGETPENKPDGWYFIASPIDWGAGIAPSSVTNLLQSDYDLYRFNQAGANGEWENYKAHQNDDFNLYNKHGYLYANKNDVTLEFTGYTKPALNADSLLLVYNDQVEENMRGWNLVGNPYVFNAYANKPYYKINNDKDGVELVSAYNANPIPPCTGIMVQATGTGQYVKFTKNAPAAPSKGSVELNLTGNGKRGAETLDNAIISFNEGSELGKFYFGEQAANIYIPQDNKEYAIVNANAQGEMPVNFKANADGQYTISVNAEDVEMGYLHLIDNLTGTDVDLLANPSYTFNASTTDYASRFRLVFSGNSVSEYDNENENFAFIGSNGQLIVNGTGTIQIIDIMGRVISTRSTEEHINTNNMTAGVYVLQLTTGSETKTQKIIVK